MFARTSKDGTTQSKTGFRDIATSSPDNVWRERIEKENRTAQILWPRKWGWLAENYRKDSRLGSSRASSKANILSASPSIHEVRTVSEMTDLPSAECTASPNQKRTQSTAPLSGRPSSTVMEVKQYLPRYSRRFTTTNIQEHGYTADHFSTGSCFNNIKYPLNQSFYKQMDWPSQRWPVARGPKLR